MAENTKTNLIEIIEEDPQQRAYNDDGVDLTLIRWMLSLTPTQRLQVLQQNVSSIARLRRAKRSL